MKFIRAGLFVILFMVFSCAVYCGQTTNSHIIDAMDSKEGWWPIGNGSYPIISLTEGQSLDRSDKSIKIEFSNKSTEWVGIVREIPLNGLDGAKGLKFAYKGSEDTYLKEVKLEYLDDTQFVESPKLRADANEWRNGEVLFRNLRCRDLPDRPDRCTCYNNYDKNINLKNVKQMAFVVNIGKNPGWFAIDNILAIPEDGATLWDELPKYITTVNIIIASIFSIIGILLGRGGKKCCV